MRTIAVSLAAAAALAGATSLASAADVIYSQPVQPTAPVQSFAPTDWSGGYLGAFGGYNFGRFSSNGDSLDADGFTLGAFGGFNFQNGDMVYGVDADVGYSFADGSSGGATADQNAFGSLRGRVGYAFDPFMVYVAAGVAATRATFDIGPDSDSNTHIGWTAGVGTDVLLTQNVFGRLEYRYTDYGSKTYTVGGSESIDFNEHAVRAGIGVKF